MAEKLRRLFSSSSGAKRLRTLVAGRDDLAAIPNDAPVYFTRLARRRVRSSPALERVLPEARVFSADSAKEVMTFVIRRNAAALHERERDAVAG